MKKNNSDKIKKNSDSFKHNEDLDINETISILDYNIEDLSNNDNEDLKEIFKDKIKNETK